jgi:hypothetical protein
MQDNINKYIGIVKIETESMVGLDVQLLTKSYNDIETINEWFNLYPESKHIILENNSELNEMFSSFEDLTPVTEEEKNGYEEAKKLYLNL